MRSCLAKRARDGCRGGSRTALVFVHAVAFVGATLVVAHQARGDAVGRRQLSPPFPCLRRGLFLARPRKRPKKKGAAQTPRGLLFREPSQWCKRAFVSCGPLGCCWTMVMDGTARKSPFRPAAFAWAPLVFVHAVAFVGATLVVAHPARGDAELFGKAGA